MPQILQGNDGPPAKVINPGGAGGIVLVCEHASSFIPAGLKELGLKPQDRYSHAAWDIGALDLARHLSAALDAPLVASRISRLVYDCNRPPEAPDAIPAKSERVEVPGNRNLSDAARAARVEQIYQPFHRAVHEVLEAQRAPVVFITIHSFTPVYNGVPRAVELGLLHDTDAALAETMRAAAQAMKLELDTRLNAPYAASDGVTHTLREHAIARQIPNVMIEVSNALIDTRGAAVRIGGMLAELIRHTGVAATHKDVTA